VVVVVVVARVTLVALQGARG